MNKYNKLIKYIEQTIIGHGMQENQSCCLVGTIGSGRGGGGSYGSSSALLHRLVNRVEVTGQLYDKTKVVEVLVNVLFVDIFQSLTQGTIHTTADFVGETSHCVSRVQHFVLTV